MNSDKQDAERGEAVLGGSAAPRRQAEDLLVARGVVKWFNHVSHYGYITCDQPGPDRYVRDENVIGASSMLQAGSRVEFEPREGGMGPEGINVRPVPERTPFAHRSVH